MKTQIEAYCGRLKDEWKNLAGRLKYFVALVEKIMDQLGSDILQLSFCSKASVVRSTVNHPSMTND